MPYFNLPSGVPFLPALARALWDQHGPVQGGAENLARVLVLLPTRRAARALADAFLQISEGRPVLLPRTAPLGDLPEEALAIADDFALPAATAPLTRQAMLARLVAAKDSGMPPDRAFRLAGDLALLLDEAATEGVALAGLERLAPPDLAEHWQRTVAFLDIATVAWAELQRGANELDPAERRVRLLHAQAEAWKATPPDHKVVIAGSTGSIPAVAELMRVVAGLKQGAVLLAGLDTALPQPAWDAIDDAHPQGALKRLLDRLELPRAAISPWPAPPPAPALTARTELLALALRPADAADAWREAPLPDSPTAGLSLIEARTPAAEADVVALAVRHALADPNARIAVITPDRDLGLRVSAALGRFGIRADDSAGEPLSRTAPGAFLRLMAATAAQALAPVKLLGLLKHPLAGLGLDPGEARRQVRRLELACLRGPRPGPGFVGLELAVTQAETLHDGTRRAQPEARRVVNALEAALSPYLNLLAQNQAAPLALLTTLLQAAEALASTDTRPGAFRLWAGEAGEALAKRLNEAEAALAGLPPMPPAQFPALFEALLEGASARTRRATAEADGEGHPRVQVLGAMEARLLDFDVAILAGLNEGAWPALPEPGPWLNRPMRAKLGLPSPERRLGQQAADFVMAATAAPRVMLVRAVKAGGSPTVPARWLTRLNALFAARGLKAEAPAADYAGLAAALDHGDATPEKRPRPVPPLELRPQKLSITEIETWIKDPYAIYARHVLRLRALDPIDQQAEQAEWGTVVHDFLARLTFLLQNGAWPTDPALEPSRLEAEADRALTLAAIRPGAAALWRPRLTRLGAWFTAWDREFRARLGVAQSVTEVAGQWQVPGLLLTGRADRIDTLADGRLALHDYKTGQLPKALEVEAGLAPQLPLTALIARAGGFAGVPPGEPADLRYLHTTGGDPPPPDAERAATKSMELADALANAEAGLHRLIAAYADPATPYHPRPQPAVALRYSDYEHLSRVGAWGAGGTDEAGESGGDAA